MYVESLPSEMLVNSFEFLFYSLIIPSLSFNCLFNITPSPFKSTTWFCLILVDSVLHSIAQRIEHVAMCTKSIKLNRLLLLDSGL